MTPTPTPTDSVILNVWPILASRKHWHKTSFCFVVKNLAFSAAYPDVDGGDDATQRC